MCSADLGIETGKIPQHQIGGRRIDREHRHLQGVNAARRRGQIIGFGAQLLAPGAAPAVAYGQEDPFADLEAVDAGPKGADAADAFGPGDGRPAGPNGLVVGGGQQAGRVERRSLDRLAECRAGTVHRSRAPPCQ